MPNILDPEKVYDVAIIGGGIVGTATAKALLESAELSLVVLEAEDQLAKHQTGHNSGVIHSGLYYKPGSLKAKNCTAGREEMYKYCEEKNIPHERCGKIVVATEEWQLKALDELERRGKANGLEGLKRLNSQEELREYEPHVRGIAGLYVPQTGIIDYKAVVRAFAEDIKNNGGEILLNAKVLDFKRQKDELQLLTPDGVIRAKNIINCAGLQSDRIARLCGVDPKVHIVPFRGEYYELVPEKRHLVKNLIYPVPDPRFPFLGVHFTRMIDGSVEAGPNAVLAFKREGYKFWQISLVDMFDYLTYSGFWKLVSKYWKTGTMEMIRSLSKKLFVKSMQELIPEVQYEDAVKGGSGVRAQALGPDGALLDDFAIESAENMIHVLNAPSPAATASICIGRTIATLAVKNFSIPQNKLKKKVEEIPCYKLD